ncbi:LysR family transcriptional regulator [Chromobacterium sphagni]|uniref:LysR family transcriptional regulator n=1 Tax=Chromobacterium sphagni TaxID=1903179 RepID=A0A1S1WY85_9NEIS|nr:LysR family transcriptional regulator [Chromobacterium sphagni]OHX12261.1 LysR family transcriptional regulator [Chromobacterium sphagni]OHX21655.1 LysR family transcriptional regulator [Chromobacterium sphagni]
MMNLMHWRLLLAVADCGTVTQAASRHGISQSGASQAIRQLEQALGMELFVRDRRETRPTALGEQVLQRARAMLAELDGIRRLADEARGLAAGRLTVAGFPSLFARGLARSLDRFRLLHPGLELLWLEGSDEEIEQWLAEDRIDLGVVLNPQADGAAQLLGEDAWMAVLPGSHPLAGRASSLGLAPETLAGQPFIAATGGCRLDGESVLAGLGVALADVRMRLRDWGSALAMVRGGLGVAVVPESVLPEGRRGLRAYPLLGAPPRRFALAASARGVASPQARALLAWLASEPV